jgi:hypothetical protein
MLKKLHDTRCSFVPVARFPWRKKIMIGPPTHNCAGYSRLKACAMCGKAGIETVEVTDSSGYLQGTPLCLAKCLAQSIRIANRQNGCPAHADAASST